MEKIYISDGSPPCRVNREHLGQENYFEKNEKRKEERKKVFCFELTFGHPKTLGTEKKSNVKRQKGYV
jgi:hypothetical protein